MVNHFKLPKNAGIYKFTCIDNGKIYIGKSINIYNRIKQHKTSKGVGFFQRAIVKYGWESFNVEVLEIIEDFDKLRDNKHLLNRESYYIELFDATNPDVGYNICKYSTDRTGLIVSMETREKMSQSQTGRRHSEESRENMRKSQLGKKQSDETKEKRKKYVYSDETKEKIRNYRLGKKHSEETKEKMRLAKSKTHNK